MSSSTQTFTLKTAKAKLTRQLNALGKLIQEAEQFQEPWTFPKQVSELQQYLSTKTLLIKNIISKLEEQKDAIWNCYNECNSTIAQLKRIEPEEGSNFEGSSDGAGSFDLNLDAIYIMSRIDGFYNLLDDINHRLDTIERLIRHQPVPHNNGSNATNNDNDSAQDDE
ncbi:hypothetical protein Aduo_016472 [Ancylostoma duodenale]